MAAWPLARPQKSPKASRNGFSQLKTLLGVGFGAVVAGAALASVATFAVPESSARLAYVPARAIALAQMPVTEARAGVRFVRSGFRSASIERRSLASAPRELTAVIPADASHFMLAPQPLATDDGARRFRSSLIAAIAADEFQTFLQAQPFPDPDRFGLSEDELSPFDNAQSVVASLDGGIPLFGEDDMQLAPQPAAEPVSPAAAVVPAPEPAETEPARTETASQQPAETKPAETKPARTSIWPRINRQSPAKRRNSPIPDLALAYASPGDFEDGPRSNGIFGSFQHLLNASKLPGPGSGVAVYDITNSVVYMPNGQRLEAHSGLGKMQDDPKFSHVRMKGPTPPNLYNLRMREARFHGVEAIRLLPVDKKRMRGRDGILAHTYLLGNTKSSNGCVSFEHYDKFLAAFKRGEVKKMIVVPDMSHLPTYLAMLESDSPGTTARITTASVNTARPAARNPTPN